MSAETSPFPAQQPVALTIAGSDSSGGAGIQADLKTFTALGVYGASVLTALTAQNTQGVFAVLPVPGDFIDKQIDAVAADLRIGAVKTGMLGDRETVETVAAAIRRHALAPLVVDPVMVATSGAVLLAPDAVDAVRRELIPLATLITPNLPEAARLLDTSIADSEDDMIVQARALRELGCQAVLLKGGHAAGAKTATDILFDGAEVIRLSKPRIVTENTHGTGCTLSAAIAAFLVGGRSLEESVRRAKEFVWSALRAASEASIGHGSGPVDHLFAIKSTASE
jgi:hydroxymethylpyrimidine/phosphomethylpyrimidine kinase